uniref:sensor histidine kinase n=1 Tax=Sphingomonas bacterium TaxID=1895847 RepID=UPI002622828D|nr:HAMP domain-containing sensor histidine kinase [Sphingomonas bacterium]
MLAHGILLLADHDGRKIAGNIEAWPPSLRTPTDWREMLLYRDGHAVPERFGLSTTRLPTGEHLLIGVVIDDRAPMREALLIALVGALLLAIPIGLAGGSIMVRFMNRRVQGIGEVAARIAAGDLGNRVETLGTKDPFDRLGTSLNAMLARIEALVEELRLVTDALAHDLRSPLMRMRAWIEKAGDASSGKSRRPAIDAISREIDGMLRMLAGSLEISRTEAGMGREDFTPFDLGALTRDLCEMYQPLAEESGVSIAVEKPRDMTFFGNRELIGQAVSNLIDNALKYASSGGSIRIGVDESDSSVSFWVADRGAGIPANRREESMRKYRRLDEARATEGSGLGLALVRAVARLHEGELILEDNRPGLRAVISLPSAHRFR